MSAAADLGPAWIQPLFQTVNFMCQPVIFYSTAIVTFFGALAARKFLVKPPVAIGMAVTLVLFLLVSLLSPQFYREATKSDNAPIWIMLTISCVCMWAALWQAVNNDERMAQGLRPDEAEAAEEKL